jgi:uncharacterized membrane protein
VPEAQPVERNVRWAWPITFPLALIGLADSVYLTITHFRPKALACSASGHINCEKVTESAQSEIFGHIPVAIVGLAFFVVAVVVFSPWVWKRGNLTFDRLRLAGITASMGMVIYLITVEAHLHAICLYCTGVHIVTFLLFVTTLAAYLLRPLDVD